MDRETYDKLAAAFEVKRPLAAIDKNASGQEAWTVYIQEREIKRVQCWIEHGLHPVYNDWFEAMCDYFPDFSWNTPGFIRDMRTMLANQEWLTLCGRLKEVRGYDLVREMQLALDEADAEERQFK